MQSQLFSSPEPQTSSLLEVALPVPLRRTFDYILPNQHNHQEVKPGQRVQVKFHGRELVGVILKCKSTSAVPTHKLKHINQLIDNEPLLPSSLLQLLCWAANYYCHPIGEVICGALPKALAKGEPPNIKTMECWHATTAKAPIAKNAKKQQELLNIIRASQHGIWACNLKEMGFTSTQLNSLKGKGLIISSTHTSLSKEQQATTSTEQPSLILNEEQTAATIELCNKTDTYSTTLLQGITGSGKTEVYLAFIRKILNLGKQVLMLVPEINLTPQTLLRVQKGLNARIGVLHSGLSTGDRMSTWLLASQGEADVIIGTRSAIFTPFQKLGGIIVDEEHDASFKQQEGFRYSARDLAVKRGLTENCPVILGSATPSLESYANATQKKYRHITLTKRAGEAKPPTVELLDIQTRPLQGGLSAPLIQDIKSHLNQDQQVMIFLNRRGYSPTLMCQDCNWMAMCRNCDARLTLHTHPTRLHCHHCDARTTIPAYCPQCKSSKLRPLGVGTVQIEETCSQLFADYPIIRIDRDSTRKKDAMKKILEEIHQGKPCILIGTQMLAKGHDFPNVTLVAILDADSGLFSANYRAEEQTAQQLIQVSGRSGRSTTPGKVIIQTTQGTHPLMQLIAKGDYDAIAQLQLEQRQLSGLPPFSPASKLTASSKSEQQAESTLTQLKTQLRSHAELTNTQNDIQMAGPFASPIARKANTYYYELSIFYSNQKTATHGNAFISTLIEGLNNRHTTVILDINPQS